MENYILTEEKYRLAEKSLKVLINHSNLENKSDVNEVIYLGLRVKCKIPYSNEQFPHLIPITHKLSSLNEKTILIITKDDGSYSDLNKKNSPTENCFKKIISFKEFSRQIKHPKYHIHFFRLYDLILIDHILFKFVPKILGLSFKKYKHKFFLIQMKKSSEEKKNKVTVEEKFDSFYVKKQLKAICKFSYYIPPYNGKYFNIKIGDTGWDIEKLLTNINDVLIFLIKKSTSPYSGFIKCTNNIENLYLKTPTSISLPILYTE